MTGPFITEERVQQALDYLYDNAEQHAAARAERVHMEDYQKSLEALLMKEFDDGQTSAVIQKRNALSHSDYLRHLEAKKEAVFRESKFQYLREAEKARIEAFQTLSANYRGMKL
jgi:hypothetical protein